MSGGTAIEFFNDFMLSTGPAFLRGPEDIVNDAVKETYTWPKFISGKSMKDMLQGGNSIKDNILLGTDSSARNYKPSGTFNYRNPQVLSQWSVPWRFTADDMLYTDHEIELNSSNMSLKARFHKFKEIKYSKEQNTFTGMMAFLDDQFWDAPDFAEMEGTDGETPNSIPCFVTENGASGLIGQGTVPLNGPDATAWTTVMGISPIVKAGWRNGAYTYDAIGSAGSAAAIAGNHLFKAFTFAFYKSKFDRLPKYPALSDKTSIPHFIASSLSGLAIYEDALRVNQDTFVMTGRQDPAFTGPQFHGIEMCYIRDLDDAAIFPGTAGSLATEATATNNGPRWFWINGEYMLKVIKNNRYFYKKKPFSPSGQPFTHICIVDIWHNNVARSRKRHAIVYPSADILS